MSVAGLLRIQNSIQPQKIEKWTSELNCHKENALIQKLTVLHYCPPWIFSIWTPIVSLSYSYGTSYYYIPYLLLYICAGPDRPYINVPEIVVAGMHQLVTVTCSVQTTAYVDDSSDLKLNWKMVRCTIQLLHNYDLQWSIGNRLVNGSTCTSPVAP